MAELDGKTPLEAAETPNMDRLAREGLGGSVQIIPASRHPGSDIGNLEIFGYDSRVEYTGRAPLEASSMGVELDSSDVAFRCNLITRDGDTLVDYSAGHIATDTARQLIQLLSASLGSDDITLYPGVSYRHLLVYKDGPDALESFPPHDIMGQSIAEHLPRGEGADRICGLMEEGEKILQDSEAANGSGANSIWLWGSGRSLKLTSLQSKYGIEGGVISAVDLVRGIGRCAGLDIIEVPGITGYLDTNYAGKADYALAVLDEADFVYVHVEAPDEAGHIGDAAAKKQAIEDFDRLVVGRILQGLGGVDQNGVRILMSPDHRTPIALRTHSREPVPFVLWGDGFAADGMSEYSESGAESGSLHLDHGHEMMSRLTV